MFERGRGTCLAQNPLAVRIVGGTAQELDRHPAIEPGVVGQKDLAHAAGAEALAEAIVQDEAAWLHLLVGDAVYTPA